MNICVTHCQPITTSTLWALYTLHFLTITPYSKFILPGQPFIFSDSLFQILKSHTKFKISIHSGIILFKISFQKVDLYTTKNQTKISQKFQKKPKKKPPINKSKVMSLFYILTGPTLSLLVTLTDSFPSNSKPSLYILGLARPHLSSIFLLSSAAFKVQLMSHFRQAPCR